MLRLAWPLAFLVFAFLHFGHAADAQQRGAKSAAEQAESSRQTAASDQAPSILPHNVESMLDRLQPDTSIGIVVLDHRGKIVFQHNAEMEMPAASSIKSILVLELFAKYEDELDTENRDDVAAIVNDPKHPAIAHFRSKSKRLVAEKLARVSIRQLGSILVDSNDLEGNEYSNSVYNAAANVAIALLGGPEECTALMQKRHEAFQDVHMRRYMLANRNVTGDNTATPLSLATLFSICVGKSPKGVKARTTKQIAEILHSVDYRNGAQLFSKGGTLYSNPVTQVRSGQYRTGQIRMNYAIMASQQLKSKKSGKQQYESLKKLTGEIYAGLKNPK